MNIIRQSRFQLLHNIPKRSFAKLSHHKTNTVLGTETALANFDEFYGAAFGPKWPSIRLGLLSPNKYCAVINPFVDQKVASQQLSEIEAVDIKRYVKYNKRYPQEEKLENAKSEPNHTLNENDTTTVPDYDAENRFAVASYMPVSEMLYQEEIISEQDYLKNAEISSSADIKIIEEEAIRYPKLWNIFTFPKGFHGTFPRPTRDALGLYNYYLLDGASLLPIWALGINFNDEVGDFCAAPGGKSLLALFTLKPSALLMNDNSGSRMKRLRSVLELYIPEFYREKVLLQTTMNDVIKIRDQFFDKILVDIPCTNDRQSLTVDYNNFYSSNRHKERANLPEKQANMLYHSLKALKHGGALVYSTCTLSPAQNDGVVYMALMKALEETNSRFSVVNLKSTFEPISDTVRIDFSSRFGATVLPYLPCNFGPMYICKIRRLD